MPRLRRADCSAPGLTRRRRGRGFEYRDELGERLRDDEALGRIRELAIPPAWTDVWICSDPRGHLQATGIDAAGRRQYLYHPVWRERRDRRKFEDMLEFAAALPRLRDVVARDLDGDQLDRTRVLACSTRLLDRGFFRIGSEGYAEANSTYGLATLLKSHVWTGGDGQLLFDYPAKGSLRRIQLVVDAEAHDVVAALKRRRGGSEQLLAYREGRRWRDVRSDEVNEYLRDAADHECSAKDFRTWNATVLAAVALAVAMPAATRSKTSRERAITHATREVARYLGNTPAVCRSSYIDPRVFDRFRAGSTIAGDLTEGGDLFAEDARAEVEAAVRDLLNGGRA